MAKKKRVTRKTLLKEPDEFMTLTGKTLEYVTGHKTLVSWAMGIVAGIVVIALSVNYFIDAAEDKAFVLLDQATADYSSVKEAKGSEEAFLEVEASFQEIVDKYSGRKGGQFARLIFADISAETGRVDKAISLYLEALGDFEMLRPYGTLILRSLGYAYEEKEDFGEAIQYFVRISSAANGPMKDEALFALGRLYTANGQKEEGIDSYRQLLADFPDYVHADIAREKIGG